MIEIEFSMYKTKSREKMKKLSPVITLVVTSIYLIFFLEGCRKEEIIEPPAAVAPLWEKSSFSFSRDYFPTCLVVSDSLNIWGAAVSCPGLEANLPIKVIFSHDGGKTWDSRDMINSNKVTSGLVSPVDGNTAFIYINEEGLMKTTNGGSTWTKVREELDTCLFGSGLHFFDVNTGIGIFAVIHNAIVDDTLAIYKTTDGGLNWSLLPSALWGGVIPGEAKTLWMTGGGIKSAGDTIGYVTGCGRIIISKDRGMTWDVIKFPGPNYESLYCISMINSKTFSVASYGRITFVDDQWEEQPYTYSKILTTEDGGNSWSAETAIPTTFASLSNVPWNKPVILANCFYDIVPSGTFISTDKGNTFTEVDSLKHSILLADFYSMNHGFGISFGYGIPGETANYIYRWNPGILYEKKILQ
ncbi:MAG: YCF48-related protein [Bacteroidales bacterium]|nr:YCF48-related protein [Bacteroidales bacterium]